jgi:hypothetical protein
VICVETEDVHLKIQLGLSFESRGSNGFTDLK